MFSDSYIVSTNARHHLHLRFERDVAVLQAAKAKKFSSSCHSARVPLPLTSAGYLTPFDALEWQM